MDLILLERVEKLGQMGDLVRVRDGFARNFLLPQGKALRATEANKSRFETQKAELEARNLERKGEAESVGGKLNGESVTIIRQAGESGQLYGSVAARDIAEALTAAGFAVDKNQVVMVKPVKTLGLFEQAIRLHPEVSSMVTVNVARSEEEAERQARGENVLATADDEDEAIDIDDVFEEEVVAEIAEELAATDEGADVAASDEPAAAEEAGEEEEKTE